MNDAGESNQQAAVGFRARALELEVPSLQVSQLIYLSEISAHGKMLVSRVIGVFRDITPKVLEEVEFFAQINDPVGAVQKLALIDQASERIGAHRLASLCRLASGELKKASDCKAVVERLDEIANELSRVDDDLTRVSALLVDP